MSGPRRNGQAGLEFSDADEEALRNRYRKAFSSVRTSEGFEVDLAAASRQASRRRFSMSNLSARARRAVVAGCAALAVVAGGSAAYAADLGGIQHTVQIWLHGEQAAVTMVADESAGTYELYDENGEVVGGGGGIVYDIGGERPATADEMAEQVSQQLATETVDGRMYLYNGDQKLDITDSFDENDLCHVTLQEGDHALYVVVEQDGSATASTEGYIEP